MSTEIQLRIIGMEGIPSQIVTRFDLGLYMQLDSWLFLFLYINTDRMLWKTIAMEISAV